MSPSGTGLGPIPAGAVSQADSAMNDVTRILSAIEQGDPQAAEQLLPLVYDELRKLAAQRLAREKPGQTLQATALVHDAYLRLVGAAGPRLGQPRPLLRRRRRGDAPHPRRERPPQGEPSRPAAGAERVDLAEAELAIAGPRVDLLALDEALRGSEAKDRRKAELVKLRYFAGLTVEQAAAGARHLRRRRPTTTGPTPGAGSAWPCSGTRPTSPGLNDREFLPAPLGRSRRRFRIGL